MNKLNYYVAFLILNFIFISVSLYVDKFTPSNYNYINNEFNQKLKLFYEILIHFIILYVVICLYNEYIKGGLVKIFNLNENIFFLDEMYIILLMILVNKNLLMKIKNLIYGYNGY